MSVRVNLLPEATRTQDRANQQRILVGALALAFLAVLGGLFWWQSTRISNLESELAQAENRLAMAISEQGDLAVFADIDQRVAQAQGRLTSALSTEVSVAGILQDIAAVTPADTGLTAFNLTIVPPNDETPALTVGSVNLTGQVTSGIAPGVERILLDYGKVGSFDEPVFNSTTVDEDGVATFSLEVGLLPTARTDRYSDGLPEELRR